MGTSSSLFEIPPTEDESKMKLTDRAIRNLKPKAKNYKKYDGSGYGLFIQVNTSGSKTFGAKGRYQGRAKSLSFGKYPNTTLKDARAAAREAQSLLSRGIDPNAQKRAKKSTQASNVNTNTLETIARQWHKQQSLVWTKIHSQNVLGRLERDLFPPLGRLPIADISQTQILEALRKIEARGALETARRVLGNTRAIYDYARGAGLIDNDPLYRVEKALTPVKKQHLAAITDPEEVSQLLKSIEAYSGTLVVESALKFAPLVFQRPGEIRHARWVDIDFERKEWNFKPSKRKDSDLHNVPLSRQALAILTKVHQLTGSSEFVFPNARSKDRAMSNNAILAAMRRMEISKESMCGHGFRAMARTILDEVLGFRVDIIEYQLAHAVRTPLGRAYNRTTFRSERIKMMQDWADYLEDLKA